jgi:hypothetical protein
LDRLLAAAVVCAGQIVVSLLIAGAVLRALKPGVVLLINAAIAGIVFGLTRRMKSHVRLSSFRFSAADLRRKARAHRWVALLLVTAALALLWRLLIAYAFPPYGYDTLAYHLPTVAGWLQYSHIGTEHLHIYQSSFPANMELLFAWVALLLHSDVWIGAVQVPVAVMGAAAVVGLARLAQVGRAAALAAGALFVLSPIVLTQASSNYVDLGVAAFFLVGIYFILRSFPPAAWGSAEADGQRALAGGGWSWSYLVLAGCAIGLAIGAKATGPLLALVSLLCLVTGMLLMRRRRLDLAPQRPLVSVLLLLLPMILLGTFWYVRDVVEFSNPLYPANVKVLGFTVFHGTVLGIPSRLPTGSGLNALVHSWGHDLTRLYQHGSGKYDRADEFEGGLGLVWLLLGLPLLIPFVIGAWKRNRVLFWTFLVPLAVLFAIQPYRWWNRFTIFLLAPGLVALVLVVDRSSSARARAAVRSLTLACVAISLWFSSSHVVGWKHVYDVGAIVRTAAKPKSQRTLGRLFIPELRWVDHVPPKARIAALLHVSIRKDEFPPFYGLYGRQFRHSVFALPRTTRANTLRWLDARSIGYVYVRRPSAQDAWLHGDRRFRLLFGNAKVAAYVRLDSEDGVSASSVTVDRRPHLG